MIFSLFLGSDSSYVRREQKTRVFQNFSLLLIALTALAVSATAFAQERSTPPRHPISHRAAVSAASSLPQVATPQFSVTPGVYSGAQTVSITDTTPGATIYYSTNGAFPSTSSAKFSSPITVSASEVIVAYATASGYVDSAYAVGRYTISSVPSSFLYSIAGNGLYGYSGDGGLATAAELQPPSGVAVDSAGNIYLSDSVDNVIRKITKSTGIISTIAGSGTDGDTGDGGPATSATLNSPSYLAVDTLGNLYIGEAAGKIRLITASTGQISTYASVGQITGMTMDSTNDLYVTNGTQVLKFDARTGVSTTLPQNSYPFMLGLAVDIQGNAYFAESGYSVVAKLNAQTGAITTVAGSNTFPYSDPGDGGPATNARLGSPSAVAFDASGNLYILDNSDCAIRKVQPNGIINTVAGNWNCYSEAGDGDPALSAGLDTTYASYFAVGASGQIYLSMALANDARLWEITAPALPPTASLPSPALSVAAGSYDQPQTITASDSVQSANIYLSTDGNTPLTNVGGYYSPINAAGTMTVTAVASAPGYLPSAPASAKYTINVPSDSIISTVAGDGKGSISLTGGPALSTSMDYPAQAVADSAGSLYIPDSFYDVVWKLSAATGNLTAFAGLGPGNWGTAGDGGPATSAEFYDPISVAVDQAGNVYIADASGNRIRKVAASTGIITTVAGGGNGLLGDGGPATSATLSSPYSIALDGAGNLYIADIGNNRVRVVSAATGIISTYAGNGTTGPVGDGGAATNAALSPYSIAFDAAGNLYIMDTLHNTLRKVDAQSGNISTIAGNGTGGGAGDGGPATAAEVSGSLAVDGQGNIYISGFAGVRKIDAKTGIISTAVGTNYLGYGGDGGPAEAASLRDAWGISFDAAGNLYIADSGNAVIRKVSFLAPAATPTFSLSAGTYTSAQTLTISDSTANATIYYTTDGTTPTTGSTQYSGAITVAQSETVNAIAIAPGLAASSVATAAYTINLATPSIKLASSANPIFTSNPVTFTATLTATSGTPTGTVNFLDGGTQIGSATLSNGVAAFTTSSLAAGSHSITAVYNGDANFTSVTSAALTETVEDFSFAPPSGGSTSATASPGGTATYNLTVTPPSGGALASPITFSVSGLPTGATATFNPATVPANSGATNVTLTIQLPASAALVPADGLRGFGGAPLLLGFVLLPFLGLRKVRRALNGRILLLALALAGIAGLGSAVGCGSGGSGSRTTSNPQQQTYTLTVTATAGSLSHNTTLTLTVQ